MYGQRQEICGAGIALHYTLAHPGVCQSVSFTNGNSALRDAWSEADLQAQADLAARVRKDGAAALRAIPYHPAHARRFPADIRTTLVAEAARVTPETVALLQQEALPRLSVRARLAQMQPPCLLINGTLERRFQPLSDWLAQTHPQIGIIDLPGGH
ncbi:MULTISPECIES: hypothetical protein [unclassified Yoonia]|uniref:hypothetical protein n=1 Tax=unclassified Yoonia TaxID=2629118 RepID=UPI002B002ED7|nr:MULTISPECIES: hypothetical protein [unclassified Yoonia]